MVSQDFTGQVLKRAIYPRAGGLNADVWEAALIRDSHITMVAVKVLKGPVDLVWRPRLRREILIWVSLTHPNITPLFGISYDFDRPGIPCLVSPWYQNGHITSYLKEYPDADRLTLTKEIAEALLYLHDMFIIHGDIKGSNILINDEGKACITDFSQSRILQTSVFAEEMESGAWPFADSEQIPSSENEELALLSTEAWRWKAPELIETPENVEEGFIQGITSATDVWAFAMTVIEIFSACIPFSHIRNDARVILAVMAGDRPKREHCPQLNVDVWTMLDKCWDVVPSQRPSMATLSRFFALQSDALSVKLARL